jgi:hypothetical protein
VFFIAQNKAHQVHLLRDPYLVFVPALIALSTVAFKLQRIMVLRSYSKEDVEFHVPAVSLMHK